MAASEEHYRICVECIKRKESLSMQTCISCEQSVYNFDILPQEYKLSDGSIMIMDSGNYLVTIAENGIEAKLK